MPTTVLRRLFVLMICGYPFQIFGEECNLVEQSYDNEKAIEFAVNRFAKVLEGLFLKYGAEVLDEIEQESSEQNEK